MACRPSPTQSLSGGEPPLLPLPQVELRNFLGVGGEERGGGGERGEKREGHPAACFSTPREAAVQPLGSRIRRRPGDSQEDVASGATFREQLLGQSSHRDQLAATPHIYSAPQDCPGGLKWDRHPAGLAHRPGGSCPIRASLEADLGQELEGRRPSGRSHPNAESAGTQS